MKPKRKETIQGLISILSVAVLVVVLISIAVFVVDRYVIASAIGLASLSVDIDNIAYVHSQLAMGNLIMNTAEYQAVVSDLKHITERFPGDAQWSYIAAPGDSNDTSRLTILTIQPKDGDQTTMPNYLYNIENYPAMRKAIYGDDDIVVSSIVWDKTYRILTRTGFAKLYDSGGNFIGVLGVDMTTWHLVFLLLIIMFGSVIVILATSLAWLKLAQGLGMENTFVSTHLATGKQRLISSNSDGRNRCECRCTNSGCHCCSASRSSSSSRQ
jgi:hypothetical protein